MSHRSFALLGSGEFEPWNEEVDRWLLGRADGRDGRVLILRNHGLLTCGETVARAFFTMFNLEKSCRAQIAAMSTGATLIKLSPNLMEHAAGQFEGGYDGRAEGWPSLLKMLDSIDPSYRT